MNEKGQQTLQEILSQPVVWADTLHSFGKQAPVLKDFWNQNQFDQVIFTGCGSTHYLSLSASVLFQQLTGVLSSGLPASD